MTESLLKFIGAWLALLLFWLAVRWVMISFRRAAQNRRRRSFEAHPESGWPPIPKPLPLPPMEP